MPTSQREMREYTVRDLDVDELAALFKGVGFAEPTFKASIEAGAKLSLKKRNHYIKKSLTKRAEVGVRDYLSSVGIMHFAKGEPRNRLVMG